MGIYASDIETTGLLHQMMKQENPKLHNLCSIDVHSDEVRLFEGHQREEIQAWLNEGHTFVMHYGSLFDLDALELLGYDTSKVKLIDTVPLSWYLEPNRVNHGLEQYGEEFGVPKPEIKDWESLTQAEYNHRVMEDCKIQKRLWHRQVQKLKAIYGDEEGSYDRLITFLMQKMNELRQQQQNRWKLDVPAAEALKEKLEGEIAEKVEALKQVMPKQIIYKTRSRPAKPFLKTGELSATGKRWKELTERFNLPFEHTDDIKEPVGEEIGNPASHTQMKAWLDSLGWEPLTFKFVKGEPGKNEDRNIPQINLKGGEICESVKELIPKCAGIEHIAGLGILNHRYGVVKGFLRDAFDGELTAGAAGFTNTLRLQHREIVNLPSLRVKYGAELRGLLVARPGKKLLGSDLSSLEDRLKHHFQWVLDPEYVKTQMAEDFDPHLMIAGIAGLLNQDEIAFYKWMKAKCPEGSDVKPQYMLLDEAARKKEFKRIDEIRAVGKSTNYACLPTDNTEVLTHFGWKMGKDVVVGEKVMGYNEVTKQNEWTEVTATHLYQDAYVETRGHQKWYMESTLNHRWYGWQRKQKGDSRFAVDWVKTTEEINSEFNIINTAPFVGGESDVKPEEAALVAWLLSDGHYKWSSKSEATSASGGKKKGIVASIAQATHKYVKEVRDCLRSNKIGYNERIQKVDNGNNVIVFDLRAETIRNFLDRVVACRKQKHEVDWVKWVLSLSKESVEAFVQAFWLADGDSKNRDDDCYMTFKQNVGNISEALCVAGYMMGYNVTNTGNGKCKNIRFQKDRYYTTCQRFTTQGSRKTEVFCLTTGTGSFVIRQNGYITITGNCQYGAGVATIARTAKCSNAVAKKLHAAYHKMNWTIAEIAKRMKVKKTPFGEWQYNPISKYWYSLRSEKDRFSTLIQGSGAYILDLWLWHAERLAKKRGLEWCLLGQFHDEKIIEFDDGQDEVYTKLIDDALQEVNKMLKLNRELACGIDTGYKYSDIH